MELKKVIDKLSKAVKENTDVSLATIDRIRPVLGPDRAAEKCEKDCPREGGDSQLGETLLYLAEEIETTTKRLVNAHSKIDLIESNICEETPYVEKKRAY